MFKAIIEKSTLPVLVVDGAGRILLSNKGLEAFCGYSPGELVGGHLRDLSAPYERNRYVFRNLARIAEPIEMDIDLRVKSGQSITAGVMFAPFEHLGRPHLLLVLRDVTGKRVIEGQQRETEERYRKLLAERNHLEAQLNRSIKLACLGELAAGIAHEINNPLGIILGFAQDLLDEMPADNPMAESVRIIEQETARCVDVVKSLLDLARLKPPIIAEVSAAQLVEETIALLMPQIKKNRIQVRCDIEAGMPSLRVDSQQMQQALLNLLINAIQAMPLGGELTVAVRRTRVSPPARNGHRVRITITDTGHGIAAEHFGRIFDPFFSTKGTKGTGLGLTVCQRIIEDHRGRIEVESREGVGTTCFIALPGNTENGDP